MTEKPGERIDTIRDRLETGYYDDVSDADAETLLALSDRIQLLGPSEYGEYQHLKLLKRNRKLAAEVGGIAAITDDRDVVEDLVQYINTEQTASPETNKDYRTCLRQAGGLLSDGAPDELPDTVEWVPGGYPKDYDPAPDPAEMLRWQADVVPMLEACRNSRDRAVIALAWDLGPRPGELYDLRVGAISDHKYGKQVTIQGKQGQRSPIIIPAATYVRKWLNDHPGGKMSPFCAKLNSDESISNNMVRDIFEANADRAGVDKPTTPRNFRRSSASYLASQGVSQAHLEDHHGWVRGSDIASRYIAVFDDANEREIARAHGVDVSEDEPEDIGPVVCPRCEQKTPREQEACVWCGQVLSPTAAEKVEEQRQDAIESLTQADGDTAAAIAHLEQQLGDDTSVRIELVDE